MNKRNERVSPDSSNQNNHLIMIYKYNRSIMKKQADNKAGIENITKSQLLNFFKRKSKRLALLNPLKARGFCLKARGFSLRKLL